MRKKLIGLFGIFTIIIFGYSLNEFVVSDFFVETLENNRISIYFVNDCIFVFALAMFLLVLIHHLIRHYVMKNKPKKTEFDVFWYALIVISIFRFVLADNYPNVPRQDIGYFYKIPEGQTITYPKYPR